MSFKKLTKTYWSKRGTSYDKSPGHTEFEHIWESFILKTLQALRYKPSHALDAGCGTGFLSKILKKYGIHTICLDIAEGMLIQAKRKLGEEFYIDFVQGDCEKVPLRDRAVDLVVSRHVLWALERPHATFISWLKVLRTGGLIISFDGRWYPRSAISKMKRIVLMLLSLPKQRVNIFLFLKYNILRLRWYDNVDIIELLLNRSKLYYKFVNLTRVRQLLQTFNRRLRLWRSQYYMIVVQKLHR